VINVQGDQPCLDPRIVEQMICEARYEDGWVPVITPVYPLGASKLHDPNVVKVLRAADGRAITFSRSGIPHVRDVPAEQWHKHTTYWGHVGIYGYRADVLENWAALPHSALEGLEKLEQLRLVEGGIPIITFSVGSDCFSVDTASQLEQARTMLKAEN
jgi:3-deoxy-manno-octulosonate cytidylyltransferase (CMP-KDO synthetase)